MFIVTYCMYLTILKGKNRTERLTKIESAKPPTAENTVAMVLTSLVKRLYLLLR